MNFESRTELALELDCIYVIAFLLMIFISLLIYIKVKGFWKCGLTIRWILMGKQTLMSYSYLMFHFKDQTMTLYKLLTDDKLEKINSTAFTSNQILEQNLQKIILQRPEILGEELLIISEEYCAWQDSKKRIDLLAIDQDGSLVVIEIKRDNGFHMDLQAVRYAGMLSQMNYDNIVETYQVFLDKNFEQHVSAKDEIQRFLAKFNEDIAEFASDIRIILVSNEFSKEITAVSLWLRTKNVDIKCVKLEHYRDEENQSTYIDSDVIIPLKEAEDYLISIQKKEDRQLAFRRDLNNTKDYTKYEFKGERYGKGRLVLAVMQDFVENNEETTLEELQAIFPKGLQHTMEVVVDGETASDVNSKGYKRYYNQEDEVIRLNNGDKVFVSSQWGIGNIDNFIQKANEVYKQKVITTHTEL